MRCTLAGHQMIVHDVSGLATTDPLDASSTMAYGDASDPFTSGTSTTSVDGDYVFGYEGGGSNLPMTAGSGFTLEATDIGSNSEDMIQASAGPISAGFTPGSSFPFTAGMMGFKGE